MEVAGLRSPWVGVGGRIGNREFTLENGRSQGTSRDSLFATGTVSVERGGFQGWMLLD